MEIRYGKPPISLSENEFHALDYQVMGLAFGIHNEMGNLWNEHEYRKELGSRCRFAGMDASEEVPVTIELNGFRKTYFIDLLINGAVYELKTASGINDHHEAQLLNYLFLTNTKHGKIINFRPDSLQWRFVSTSIHQDIRRAYAIDTTAYHPIHDLEQDVLKTMEDLLSNWGSFLSIHLYQEALCHFLQLPSGQENERFFQASPSVSIHISSLADRRNNLGTNLKKYLNRSAFETLLWINFNHHTIEFTSLHNSALK